ncbi:MULTISPECIES: hypothetical protein [unclassified Methylophilus]|uniref:hypothetical protein n=1 Tax=unclassified Methylophilus TaxID=2630143 RepID=UPI0006F8969B|nr:MULTISPECIES: hypothetical protein [unclassified Methylophilus]KQT42237.1 hypothetical protein ASG34_05615 [Methylophilus sp. Leaf416]KQT56419.1 hypothetical protein ASG44_05590 [Methylophilus sp. Leaf459]
MADNDFTASNNIAAQAALNRIVSFRNQILDDGYDSLYSHGSVNEKRRRSNHMTLCVMVDALCDALEGEVANG